MRWIAQVFVVVLVVGFAVPARAQLPSPLAPPAASETPPTLSTPAVLDLDKVRGELATQLDAARRRLAAAQVGSTASTAATTSASAAAAAPVIARVAGQLTELLSHEVDTYERAILQVGQIEGERQSQETLTSDLELLQGKVEAMTSGGPKDEPPYSFLRLDELEDRLAGQERRAGSFEAAVRIAKESLASAEQELQDAEVARRQAAEMAGKPTKDPAEKLVVRERLEAAQIESRNARLARILREAELENQKHRRQVFDAEMALLKAERDWVAARSQFTAEDVTKKKAKLDASRTELLAKVAKAREDLRLASRELATLRAKREAGETGLEVQERARRAQVEALRLQVAVQQRWSEWLIEHAKIWDRRFQLVSPDGVTSEDRRAWRVETDAALARMDREERLQNARLADIRKDLLDLERDLERQREAGTKINWWTDFRRKQLGQVLNTSLENLEAIEGTRREWQKLDQELKKAEGGLLDYDYWGELKAAFFHVWDLELMAVDDRSITIGKLVVALLLIIVGYWISRRVSVRFSNWLEQRFGLEEGAKAGLESILFYVLVVLFTLLALQVAAVPLTVFAFLGGALAIGIGFGSQNLVNNFISGLILLVERPIRVGDRVEVDGTFGQVTQVGARCTRIRTPRNIEVLVPNSYFLESSMVNWTLNDQRVRLDMPVGVAYGSDLQLVKRLLLGAAEAHGLVLKHPDPAVVFMGHGDSSLDLELRVWVKMVRDQVRDGVPSDLRFMIDLAFRDNKVEIPFPQRDLNFRNVAETRVLPVPVADEPTEEAPAPAGSRG